MLELRSMELPTGSDDELRNMMHEELLADSSDGDERSVSTDSGSDRITGTLENKLDRHG